MTEILKPCPFCGNHEIAEKTENWHSPKSGWYIISWLFGCDKCGVYVKNSADRHTAINAWNKRA